MTPGISILAMRLPGVRIQPFTFAQSELARLENGAALVKELDLYPNENPKFMVLGDPATCDPSAWPRCSTRATPARRSSAAWPAARSRTSPPGFCSAPMSG